MAVGVLFCATACGAASDAPSLEDFGAAALGGQGGQNLGDRCGTLPMPESVHGIDCAESDGSADSGSVSDSQLDAGEYGVVLLCDGVESYSVTVEYPEDAAGEFVVPCAEGTDVAVQELFTLEEPGRVTLRSSREGTGYSAAVLVRRPG